MNDLVYVMYNLKLKNKQIRKTPELEFEAVHSDDEWITEDAEVNAAESFEHSNPPLDGDPSNTNESDPGAEFDIPPNNSSDANMGEATVCELLGDPNQHVNEDVEEEQGAVNDKDGAALGLPPEPHSCWMLDIDSYKAKQELQNPSCIPQGCRCGPRRGAT
ncbi:hypothetical protein PIB30_100254 [Stylosanthes scabra]|uniref:Uncharacterized protein n=1 Tax=Stylosanthes scabra TaxID=79078 RepID=A0ABU6ZVS6_9FABA|nr:hypothetical protein [Stylosanthes scabra]